MQMSRWLGLDIGSKVIGVAVSDPLKLTARPLTSLRRTTIDSDLQALVSLCREHSVEKIIVGRPARLSGEPSPFQQAVTEFAGQLEEASMLPLVWSDERLSSKEAERLMAEQGIRISERRKLRDQYAAALILQWYLDEQ